MTGRWLLLVGVAAIAWCGVCPAAMPPGVVGDGLADLFVGGRDLILSPDGEAVSGFVLTSDIGLLGGDPYAGGLGLFVSDGDWLTADQFGYVLTGPHDLGRVLALGDDLAVLGADLTLSYTVEGQAGVHYGTILPATPGDSNLDTIVDWSDLDRLTDAAGAGPGALWVDCDFTGDGYAAADDYIALKRNFGVRPDVVAAVPAPAGLAILTAGSGAVLMRQRSRRRHARTTDGLRSEKRSKP